MYPLFLIPTLLSPLVLSNPLTSTPAQLLDLSPLALTSPFPSTNNTYLASGIGCFKQTKVPPFIPTNKSSCESALDDWVRGKSLVQRRTFSRNPTALDDVLLPLHRVSGSCEIYVNVINEDDEDEMTLAEVYAELLGPYGVMKQCLGQVRMPAIGGRMSVGGKGVVKAVVTGRKVGGEGA